MTDNDCFNSLGAYYYMINKCYDPKHRRFETFGGRGAGVCAAWRQDRDQFVRDMGAPPTSAHFIKCKDDKAHFSRDNCYWHMNPTYVKRTPAEKREAKARAAAAMEANRQRMMVVSDTDVLDILRMAHRDGVSASDITLLYPVSVGLIRGILAGTRRRVKGYAYPRYPKKQPRGRAGLPADLKAEMASFRAGGATVAEVAARFDVSESYVYKILPGRAAVERENARLAEVARVRHALALKHLATPPAERNKVAPSLSPSEFKEKMRKAALKRAFDARTAELLAEHYADLL